MQQQSAVTDNGLKKLFTIYKYIIKIYRALRSQTKVVQVVSRSEVLFPHNQLRAKVACNGWCIAVTETINESETEPSALPERT